MAAGEMGSLDEALSAMLSNDHGQYSSLASVMTSSNSPATGPGDLFASQYSSLQESFGGSGQQLGAVKSSSFRRSGLDRPSAPSYTNAEMPQWPFSRNEKWVLDAKNEALEVSSVLAGGHGANIRSNVDGTPRNLNPPLPGGLHRYHSAPSTFLQSLADFNEDAFSQVTESPLEDSDASLLDSYFAENLAPINERGSQQMDTEKVDVSSTLNDYEKFLVTQNDFGRSSSISPSTQPGKTEPRSLTRQDHGHGGYSTPDALGIRSRPTRSKILRQSSTPADFLAAVQDNLEESSPIFKMPSFLSSDENMISANSEENAGGKLGHGNRLLGAGELVNDPPGWLGNSSLKVRVGEPGSKLGLIRHSSLPAATRPFSPTMELDDLADFSTVPCKTRASRGFATHPRSIAERVRRTKISERMKKLQDLVPNMDRQTNTADMLDEAVEYVKQLQLQVQELSNTVVQLKERLVHCN
ncbi:hypothetical protein KC19_1G183700 [Ceratodon purpureus]|uniref:BHLH domain-containing protein n=1 Tax=Ceratodon purpureus TaxID=3225 RepID=A0A8T0J8N2_CERPU|nr:hypothetical protein KC19_1G183700 [Ceratodon purpureus]